MTACNTNILRFFKPDWQMCKHEEKKCPRCGRSFECKVGNVNQCQCSGISFNEEEKKFIGEKYNDCLCRDCLLELKNRYMMFKEKMYWK